MQYQPIVDMHSGLWVGAEALLRWPARGANFNPDIIASKLKRSDLIRTVARWVCQQIVEEYSQTLWACDQFYITVNLSNEDLEDPSFVDFIKALTAQYAMPASRLAFEITERLAAGIKAAEQIKRLRALGHLIALDDFGTGHSNLAHLDQLPVDIIKIDKSFSNRAGNYSTSIILSQMLQLAQRLDILVVFEGVETDVQAEWMIALGAREAQGGLYSKALPAPELVRAYFSKPRYAVDTTLSGTLHE